MKKFFSFSLAVIGLLVSQSWNNAQAADITFEVDMTGITVSPNGIHVVGSFGGVNEWNTTAFACTPGASNIWKTTITLDDQKNYKFKFMNGNAWGTEETVPAAIGTGADRCFQTGTADATIRFAFNGMPLAGFSLVTFQVDMSAQTVTGAVRITGGLNGWDSDVSTLAQVGTTAIYARDMYVITGAEVDYKYISGAAGWAGIEAIDGLPCVNASNNRTFTASAATETVTKIFSSCDSPTALVETASNEITTYPNPVLNTLNISGLTGTTSVQIINGIGNVVKTVTLVNGNSSINLSDVKPGLYLVQISNNSTVVIKKITKQ